MGERILRLDKKSIKFLYSLALAAAAVICRLVSGGIPFPFAFASWGQN